MRKLGISLAVTALMLSPLGWQASTAQTAAANVDRPQARVIVKFKADSAALKQIQSAQRSTERAALLSQRVGLALKGGSEIAERMQVMTTSGVTSEALAERLSAQGDVEYAVPDRMRHKTAAPNDPLYADGFTGVDGPASGQWYLRPPTATVRSSIDAETAWDVTTGSPTIVVADIDTGVRYDHPDLTSNLLPGYDMISDALVANDTQTTAGDATNQRDADASDPGDSVTTAQAHAISSTCVAEASSWHGTQTAGLIGALTGNNTGMASVGRTVRVLPVRVLGRCGGFDSDIVAGMRWAAGLSVPGVPANPNPAKVLNLSLGAEGTCDAPYPAAISEIIAAGAVIVISAGNSTGHALSSPANCAGVIAVAGLRHFGTKVGFSDLGSGVTISAPAGNQGSTSTFQYPILTTSNTGTVGPLASTYTTSTNPSFGTSFSAPLVAGTAALILSVNPALTPTEVRDILKNNARPFPTSGSDSGPSVPICQAPTATAQNECYCTTTTCGAGMLDAKASVLAAAGGLQARIAVVGTAAPTQPVQLSGSGSLVISGHSITGYQWALTNGGGIVTSLASPTNAATVSATPSATGSFTVSLTVTDDASHTSTVSRTITVAAAPAADSGGGGGALGLPWLAGLLAGILALQGLRRRASRAEVETDA
jgi:serine protease